MYHYGQYCPIAKAVEILGDRWTLLIVRDLLTGVHHFNELERGLPGISRGLLADRLNRLQRMGLLEKRELAGERRRTAYHLTQAGEALDRVIEALLIWGADWAFEEPAETDLDPLLLMWWMRSRTRLDQLPPQRVVIQFNFRAAAVETYWLLMTQDDVSLCMTDPGFPLDLLVTADLATFFQVWMGRMSYGQAAHARLIEVDGPPALTNAFPNWFAYSLAAPVVRAARESTKVGGHDR